MSTPVTCHCGEHFTVQESISGRRVNCPRCNAVIFLTPPVQEEDTSQGYGFIAPSEDEKEKKPKGRKGRPDWLQRYDDAKEKTKGEHSTTYTLIAKLAEANATLDPLGATLYLAVTHADAETSVAALAQVAISNHAVYSIEARKLLNFVGPSDATGAQQLIELILETPDEAPAKLLIETLERIGPTSLVHIKVLLELLKSKHESTRGWVAASLAKIGRPAKHAVEPLLKLTKGASGTMQVRIVEALAAIGRDPEHVLPVFLQALHHHAPELRGHGAKGLAALGAAAAAVITELKTAAAKETDVAVKQIMGEAYAKLANAVKAAHPHGVVESPANPVAAPSDDRPIEVVCKCGKHFKVKSAWAGKKAKCGTCNATIDIPNQPVPRPAVPVISVPHVPEKECSRCMAIVPEAMVLCVSCGLDFRTGKLVAKPSAPTKKSDGGPEKNQPSVAPSAKTSKPVK